MDHRQIEDGNIADLYLMNKLQPDVRSRFEEHLVACPECLDRMQTVERLRAALKKSVAANPRVSPIPRTRIPVPRYAVAVGAALLLLIAGLSAALFTMRSFQGQGLHETQSQLAQEKTRSEDLRNEVAALSKTQTSVMVFTLVKTRGADAATLNTLAIPISPQWIVFSLELPSGIHAQSYRVRILDAGGRVLSEQSDLASASADTVAFGIHSSALSAGNYRVDLEGRTPDGYAPLDNFSFRAVR